MDINWLLNTAGFSPLATLLLVGLGGLILALVPAITTFYLANVRLEAKQFRIIDLAAKRLAFWDQFLKVQLTITTPETSDQEYFKKEAHHAILQIQSEANDNLQLLAWEKNARQKLRSLPFKRGLMSGSGELLGWKKTKYWCWMFLGCLMLAFWFVVFALFISDQYSNAGKISKSMGAMIIFIYVFFYWSSSAFVNAEILKQGSLPVRPLALEKI